MHHPTFAGRWRGWALLLAAAAATFLLGLLAASILQRREEARAAAAAAADRPVGNRQRQVGRELPARIRVLQEDGRFDHADQVRRGQPARLSGSKRRPT